MSQTHRAFQSFSSTQNLPISDSHDTILIPNSRFNIILAFNGSIIKLLSSLMKAYQTYLRSIDSIPVNWKAPNRLPTAHEFINQAVKQIAQQEREEQLQICLAEQELAGVVKPKPDPKLKIQVMAASRSNSAYIPPTRYNQNNLQDITGPKYQGQRLDAFRKSINGLIKKSKLQK
ncbi:hypothetical protein BY996DRAFT_6548438 [Phakopsora pachyrhizi]|nr:hypothetical protein BY996DRAFT_6548438 [Phakopsora pachyrhizi]